MKRLKLVALFSPEHGLTGHGRAFEPIKHKMHEGVPVFSLHGETRRPTANMLEGIDVIVYDIQDIGVRCYTYATTLFYVMEAAASRGIEVVVLDRPNPIGGLVIDGLMLKNRLRSYIGYINVPFCHGMTIGELARFFNAEYKIRCNLNVIPMKGWTRDMPFKQTELPWIPTSPHIPEPDTPIYYATTGLIGELSVVNIGIGYTLPFKLIGAPWIDGNLLAKSLNALKLPGVHFSPFNFRPFYGLFRGQDCNGVLIKVDAPNIYRPVSTQFAIIGVLKSLYPDKINPCIQELKELKKKAFNKSVGSDEVLTILEREKYVVYRLIGLDASERERFKKLRAKYLLY